MSYSLGDKFKVTVFGQSHSQEMGVVIDGLPAGIFIDKSFIKEELNRRRPGKNAYSTSRNEKDEFKLVSGIVDGYSCGAPICGIIENNDNRSKDYSNIKDSPRPSHADYPAFKKYNGYNDIKGGGQFSGRLTAPLTIAGAISKDILKKENIFIASHIKSIYNINDKKIDISKLEYNDFKNIREKSFPVLNDNAGIEMIKVIEDAKNNNDSVGGVIEIIVFGLPVGVGEPLYDSIESKISAAVFSIPGVRGIQFGMGFEATKMFGSEHNDEYYYDNGKVKTKTNNHGGAIGGLSTGMPLVFQVAIKPTSSIAKIQNTINLKEKNDTKLEIVGRHDPCIVPRALPAIETITAITLLDLMMLGDFYGTR